MYLYKHYTSASVKFFFNKRNSYLSASCTGHIFFQKECALKAMVFSVCLFLVFQIILA